MSNRSPALLPSLTLLLLATGPAGAQLPAPGAGGVSTGHVHLNVPELAKHRDIWTSLGGVVKATGRLEVIEFPGIYVLLTEAQPAAASTATSANHVGFSVNDYASYRAKLEAAGERRGLPSALVPGGRVDFLPARGEAPAGSRGAAIDHIGFEVDDMDAFALSMADRGIEFDLGPMAIETIGLEIAFITDPVGTYIEITEGLADIE